LFATMERPAVYCALLALAFGVALVSSSDDAPAGKRVLVVVDDLKTRSTHSQFFRQLDERGYTLDFAAANDRSVVFKKYGEWKYDNLLLFSPSADELGIALRDVLDFIDAGKNVIFAGDSRLGDSVRTLATECNVEFDQTGTAVFDHLNFDESDADGPHSLIAATELVASSIIFPQKIDAPVLFRGVAQDIEENSELLFPVLSASSYAYSAAPGKPAEQPSVAGRKVVLVSALQARNNARVIFSGSLELFSDQFFNSAAQKHGGQKFAKSGNAAFVQQLVSWAFQERGVLRVKSVSHHRVGETEAPAMYTIKENVSYTIEIEEFKDNKWQPFSANDVQLEFRMIDPYVRTTLKNVVPGKFTSQFILPDVYGIFTFKVEHVRLGLGRLSSIVRTPVRPFRHNEYERFIESAYPYYASALSMLAGLFVFSWVFLYHKGDAK